MSKNANIVFDTKSQNDSLYADLLHAQKERENGYKGHTADEVLNRMKAIIKAYE